MKHRVLVLIVMLCGLFGARSSWAAAPIFRSGTVSWAVPNANAPLDVTFTVQVAWTTGSAGSTALDFGDGSPVNASVQGAIIGIGTDVKQSPYTVYQYTVQHTYATTGPFTASIGGVGRTATVNVPAGTPFVVQSVVDLTGGNLAGPLTATLSNFQLSPPPSLGFAKNYLFPVIDADGDPFTCRFATAAESGLPPGATLPSVAATGATPTVAFATLPMAGCRLTWDLFKANVGDQFAIHIIVESTHAGKVSSTALDAVVDIATSEPSKCVGGAGFFTAPVGQPFASSTIGTNKALGPLVMQGVNIPATATLNPPSGTMGVSPMTTVFNWTPAPVDLGTSRIVQVDYTSTSLGTTGACYLVVTVVPPSCVAGTACSTGLPGACSAGLTACNGGVQSCAPTLQTCCSTDSDCGGVMSGKVCGPASQCIAGCRGLNGNGCGGGLVCSSKDATIGMCGPPGCALDSDCGGAMSGKVCGPGAACIDGCRGLNGNGCAGALVCSSKDATIGMCGPPPGCNLDSECGSPTSGKVCGPAATCIDGCRGMGGNGCIPGLLCSSKDATIGTCGPGCSKDGDCGGLKSGKVCGPAAMCIDGCRGMNGNGCPDPDLCSSKDATIGMCGPPGCIKDSDCGGPMSGKVCGPAAMCIDGCRGLNGNGCGGALVCSSKDATIGMCGPAPGCNLDSECGSPTSGKVCGPAATCIPGCRGMGGNGCPDPEVCSSKDMTIGMCGPPGCTKDSDCGGLKSGKVCGPSATCIPGCRGMGGNGCPDPEVCSSKDMTIGMCGPSGCAMDSDCGGLKSGKVCGPSATCIDGCRGVGGNGCPDPDVCSSANNRIGICGPVDAGSASSSTTTTSSGGGTGGAGGGAAKDGIVAQGNGLLCAARPGSDGDEHTAWLFGGLLAALAVRSRSRRLDD